MAKKRLTHSIIILSIILAIAFFLRVVNLDNNPPELFGDELDVGYQAYSLLQTGRDYKGHFLPTYLQSFSEWRAPLLIYATIPFVAIFSLNEWGVRLPSAVFGSLTIVLLYFLVLHLSKNEKLSLLAAFFLAISPWHIQYSRAAFEAALMLFLIVGGLFVLLKTNQKKSALLSVLAGILFALSLYTYNTANIFVPLMMIFTTFCFFSFKKQKKKIMAVWFIFIIIIIPLIYNIVFGHAADRYQAFSIFSNQEIVGKINLMRSYPNMTALVEKIFHNKPIEWVKKIAQNYATAFSPQFLFIHGDVTFRHSLHEVGQFFWFQLPLILLGLYWVVKNFRPKQNLFWLSWLLIAPIPASLTVDGGYHATRLFLMVIPLSVLSAYGGLIIIKKLLSLKKKSIFLFGLLVLLIFLIPLMEFLHYQHYYWKHYPIDSWRWWHYGYKEAMTSLFSLEKNFNQVLIETSYEPALIRYVFWKKYDPQKIYHLDDQLKENAVGRLTGFCLDEKVCFVDFGGGLRKEEVKSNTLYFISQEKNIPGDWDWSESPPDRIEVIKTIRNPWGDPIFYLVTGV